MLIVPRRAVWSPNEAPRVATGSLTQGLLGLLWHGNGGPRELVAAPWTILDTGMTRRGRERGLALQSDGTSTNFVGSAALGAPAWKPTSLPITYLAFFNHTSHGSSSRRLAGYTADDTNPGYSIWDIYGDRTMFARVCIGGTNYSAESTRKWSTQETVRGLVCTSATLTGYDNGRSFASVATTSGSISYNATYSRKMFLGYGSGGSGVAGYGYWEALWDRALSPAEVAQISADPWILFQRRRRMFVGGGGGASVAVGRATETDTAFALGAARPAGLATEADIALARGAARPAGLAAEADTALALAVARPAGLAIETDTAIALGVARPVGLAIEADTALALSGVAVRVTGLAAETDAAIALAVARPAGIALESDTALALGAARPAGIALETNTALARGVARPAGLATETDTALELLAGSTSAAGLATEADTALALAGMQILAAGLAAEADVAISLAGVQVRAVGLATEAGAALALLPVSARTAGLALEIDAAFALDGLMIGGDPEPEIERFDWLATLRVPAAVADPRIQTMAQRIRQLKDWKKQRARR